MAAKFVRAPNSPVLIGTGLVLLLLASVSIERAVLYANPHHVPVMLLAAGGMREAVFGVALLYVALRKSQFAGATAVIVATFLIFSIAMDVFASLAFGLVFRPGWGGVAIYLALAAAILWASMFPWSWSANKTGLFWMGLTFGTLTLLLGSLTLLARL